MNKLHLVLVSFLFACSGNSPNDNPDSGQDSGLDASLDSGLDASMDSGVDAGPDSGTDQDSGPDICGRVEVKTVPVVPNVVLIVDQSGSMKDPFDTLNTIQRSRWEALRDYLLADDGLLKTYQSNVNFGLALFSGTGPNGEVCPYVTQVPYTLNNFDAISSAYTPAQPLNNTPTGDSIDAVVNSLAPSTNPTVFILATDGEPDTCEQPWPQEGQKEAVDAVVRAYSLGITTYVVAVAKEDELSQSHVNDMANAGQGVSSGAESFRITDNSELKAALEQIVSGEISCTVPLEGTVTTIDTCSGQVLLDGVDLPCETDNGYFLNGNSIELRGEACKKLKLGGVLSASFPCGTIYVQ